MNKKDSFFPENIYLLKIISKRHSIVTLNEETSLVFIQFEQFVAETTHAAFEFDSLVTSHPIYVPVDNPDEIHEIFDAISYDKVCHFKFCVLITVTE